MKPQVQVTNVTYLPRGNATNTKQSTACTSEDVQSIKTMI
jgi:hypothetical protein